MTQVRIKQALYLGERKEEAAKGAKPWVHDAYFVVLECDGRTIETPWKQGIGHRKAPKWDHGGEGRPIPPKASAVLASLLMDAQSADESFEDWASNLGYDPDSRKALAIYLECQNIATKLRAFLGEPIAAVLERHEGDAEAAAAALTAVTL